MTGQTNRQDDEIRQKSAYGPEDAARYSVFWYMSMKSACEVLRMPLCHSKAAAKGVSPGSILPMVEAVPDLSETCMSGNGAGPGFRSAKFRSDVLALLNGWYGQGTQGARTRAERFPDVRRRLPAL